MRRPFLVQFYVLPEKVYDAFYKLDDARRQITSYVAPRDGRRKNRARRCRGGASPISGRLSSPATASERPGIPGVDAGRNASLWNKRSMADSGTGPHGHDESETAEDQRRALVSLMRHAAGD
jgi:hypothetical protein